MSLVYYPGQGSEYKLIHQKVHEAGDSEMNEFFKNESGTDRSWSIVPPNITYSVESESYSDNRVRM